MARLHRHGHLDERRAEAPEQTAIDACAAIAMGRGQVATLANAGAAGARDEDHEQAAGKTAVAVERDGFNVHADVHIEAGDDLGRERLMRYGARPPLSLERLRRLPGGRVAYRLKYVSRGRAKHRIMTGTEFMARLAALIAPPRYPLVRYAGVLGPRSSWRKDVVPRPREEPRRACGAGAAGTASGGDTASARANPQPKRGEAPSDPIPPLPAPLSRETSGLAPTPAPMMDQPAAIVAPAILTRAGDVIALAPNVLSVRHWDRLLGGALYAASPRVDWASLLRRSFDVDVLQCPRCQSRLRVLAVITERASVVRILAHLGLPTAAPAVARARDPTDDEVDGGDPVNAPDQLDLGLA